MRRTHVGACIEVAKSISHVSAVCKAGDNANTENNGEIDLSPLLEEDEDLFAKQLLTSDKPTEMAPASLKEQLRRLYEAAQMKVLANAEFKRAKEEFMKHIRNSQRKLEKLASCVAQKLARKSKFAEGAVPELRKLRSASIHVPSENNE